jgi:enamine deaminase RidA (YjgF/YER057c/UK114 family)
MTRRTIENVQARAGLTADAALAAVLKTTGQDRLVTADEVADAVLGTIAGEATGGALVLGAGAGLERVNPAALGAPRGFSHGVLAPRDGRLLFVAGQTGIDLAPEGPPPFVDQFARALDKALAVVAAAGGAPTDVARCTVYVTDMAAYHAAQKPLGAAWRARFGTYYPAMALVEVNSLAERGAVVEVEATAVIGGRP